MSAYPPRVFHIAATPTGSLTISRDEWVSKNYQLLIRRKMNVQSVHALLSKERDVRSAHARIVRRERKVKNKIKKI
jgi:hypothetical protein